MEERPMQCFDGLADEPIPEAERGKRFGWTETQWVSDKRLLGLPLDDHHYHRPIGKVLHTYIGRALDDPTKPMLAFRGGIYTDDDHSRKWAERVKSGEHDGLSIECNGWLNLDSLRFSEAEPKYIGMHTNRMKRDCRITRRQGADGGDTIHLPIMAVLPSTTIGSRATKALRRCVAHLPASFPLLLPMATGVAAPIIPPAAAGAPVSTPVSPPQQPPSPAAAGNAAPAAGAPAPMEGVVKTDGKPADAAPVNPEDAYANMTPEQLRAELVRTAKEKSEYEQYVIKQREVKQKERVDAMEKKKEAFAAAGWDLADPEVKKLVSEISASDDLVPLYNGLNQLAGKIETLQKELTAKQQEVDAHKAVTEEYNKRLRPHAVHPPTNAAVNPLRAASVNDALAKEARSAAQQTGSGLALSNLSRTLINMRTGRAAQNAPGPMSVQGTGAIPLSVAQGAGGASAPATGDTPLQVLGKTMLQSASPSERSAGLVLVSDGRTLTAPNGRVYDLGAPLTYNDYPTQADYRQSYMYTPGLITDDEKVSLAVAIANKGIGQGFNGVSATTRVGGAPAEAKRSSHTLE